MWEHFGGREYFNSKPLCDAMQTEHTELSRQLDAILVTMQKKDGMGGVLRAARVC